MIKLIKSIKWNKVNEINKTDDSDRIDKINEINKTKKVVLIIFIQKKQSLCFIKTCWFFLYWRTQKITRLKLLSQISTLHKTAQHGKFILPKRVPMFNAQILSTLFCCLFTLLVFLIHSLKKHKIVLAPSIYILLDSYISSKETKFNLI